MTFRQQVYMRLAFTAAAAIALTGLALGMTAQAQDTTPAPETGAPPTLPIVFYGRGLTLMDAETGALTPWPECPDSSAIRLSPDGAWLAQRGQNGQVVLCEFASGEAIAVGEEVEDIEWDSIPAWSPDASAVAWTLTVDGAQTLYVYDLAAEETTTLAEGLPAPDLLPQVLWGKTGIVVANDSPREDMRWAALFSADGKLINDGLANNEYPTRYALVTDENGREYLERAVVWSDVVDLETFRTLLPGYIRMVSLFAPDGLSIVMNPDPQGVMVFPADGEAFTINSYGGYFGDFVPHFTPEPRNLAISPDGTAFVVWEVAKGLWRGGEMEPLPEGISSGDGSGVLWGPTGYRLQTDELMSGAG